MVTDMSGTAQPHFLSALVASFGSVAASNGFAVNLAAVVVLAALGAVFLTGRAALIRYAVWVGLAFCLADWVLVQDLGFLGGLGTDPNSMIPWVLLFFAGQLALTPEPAPEAEVAGKAEVAVMSAGAWSVAAAAAVAIVLVGAVPMAAAAASRTADPILAEAIAGDTAPLNVTAPGFSLTDQNGQPVSLAGLRGKVVLLTFLDPVCTTDCPIIGAEMKQAGVLLGAADKNVELVAVVANPTYRSTVFTQAFDREEGLDTVPNWLYLTGSYSQLSKVWQQYGITVENLPAGAMSAHNDLAVVIDRAGQIREEINADPGPGTASTQSSFSVLLSQYARQALASS
jgi:cytochrome oxidase Cu insertion factor (SCO1/SenC/PrrC family)